MEYSHTRCVVPSRNGIIRSPSQTTSQSTQRQNPPIRQHNLWSPIPPRRDILRHHRRILIGERVKPPTEPKVADLELAIGIDQQVPWFEIAMDDGRRVDVLDSCMYQNTPMSINSFPKRRDMTGTANGRHRPRRIWYTKYCTCSTVNVWPDLMIWCRSAAWKAGGR